MPNRPEPPAPLGRRLAGLRTDAGLTQQELASRLAMSRNAVSHMETGDSLPSERTIVLLAGVFGREPHTLVAGTDYPAAKADRLPLFAARHSVAEARLLALDAELRWVTQLDRRSRAAALEVIGDELRVLERNALDPVEQERVRDARQRLRTIAAADIASA